MSIPVLNSMSIVLSVVRISIFNRTNTSPRRCTLTNHEHKYGNTVCISITSLLISNAIFRFYTPVSPHKTLTLDHLVYHFDPVQTPGKRRYTSLGKETLSQSNLWTSWQRLLLLMLMTTICCARLIRG